MKEWGAGILTFICVSAVALLVFSCGGGGGAMDDLMSETATIEYNLTNDWIRYIRYYDPGLDDKWHTSDDEIEYYDSVLRAIDGRRQRLTNYTGPGIDGTWFNANDIIGEYITYYYENGNMTAGSIFGDPGSNMIWDFGGDDQLSRYFIYSYNASDQAMTMVLYDSDDNVENYYAYSYDIYGRRIMGEYYNDLGFDKIWFTSDDVLYGYYTYDFDSDGRSLRKIYYNSPGMDNIWFNGDDTISTYYYFKRNSSGYIVREDWYTSPGNNGAWFQSAGMSLADDANSSGFY